MTNGASLLQTPGPSLVSVSGRQLLVRKRNPNGALASPVPYIIRGVCWSPASATTNTSKEDPNNANVRRAEFGIWAATDIPLIKAMNVNTVRLFIDPGPNANGKAVLDQLYNNDIMVILTVDDAVNDTNRVRDVVNFYKDHPALLMWMLGSEWNINRYFGGASSVLNAAQRTQSAATLIKTLDTNHPVATSYGDIDINADGLRLADTRNYVNNVCTSVDLWGLNIYRGNTFGALFSQWEAITSKPMFIGEFGTDAFRTTNYPPLACPVNGVIDEAAQASWNLSLWSDLFNHLSARDASRVALGGTVFEWNDEWWKVSPAGSQQNCGHDQTRGGHPDQIANEEFFGIVDIARRPRQVYNVLRTAFDPAYQPTPQAMLFRAVSAGAQAGNYAEFFKDGRSIWRRPGGAGGGRGFNVLVADPRTGELRGEVQNFDTWGEGCAAKNRLISFLNSVPDGMYILLAVGDEAGLTVFPPNRCVPLNDQCTQDLLRTLENLGCGLIRQYCYWDSWAWAGIKGERRAREEQLRSAVAVPPQTAAVQISLCMLTASPTTVAAGDRITVRWAAPGGRPATDWIGIYRVGAADASVMAWLYTQGAATGSAVFTAPNQPGQYEFRYFLQDGFDKCGVSNPVTVTSGTYALAAIPRTVAPGGQLNVSWVAPSGRPRTDWIGLYRMGAADTDTLVWLYTQGAATGCLTFTAPNQPGQYEFRYFLEDGDERRAQSDPITVGG